MASSLSTPLRAPATWRLHSIWLHVGRKPAQVLAHSENGTNSAKQPLHFAAFGGHVAVAEHLAARGVEVSSTRNDGQQPLHKTSTSTQRSTSPRIARARSPSTVLPSAALSLLRSTWRVVGRRPSRPRMTASGPYTTPPFAAMSLLRSTWRGEGRRPARRATMAGSHSTPPPSSAAQF